MGRNKRIAIIGHFGGNKNILDGQTIKTNILYDELSRATDWKIFKVDTYYKNRRPLKLICDSVIALFMTHTIIVLLSGNGMKFYFPILSFFARFGGTSVYHDVIGGNLDSYVIEQPRFHKYLNNFRVNWVETDNLKRRLEKQGIVNCEVIPNFKRLNITKVSKVDENEPYRFCMFSRVIKEKGIELAIEAIERINKTADCTLCELDIYGQIDAGYEKEFANVLNAASSSVCYKGMVPYDKSVEVIHNYYALLFPTFWNGEGFPGTIVDAFSAGLPVIASDWNCNSEVVVNYYNGILYPNENISDLTEAIAWMIDHKLEVKKMRENCISSAKLYQPDLYINRIIKEINQYY